MKWTTFLVIAMCVACSSPQERPGDEVTSAKGGVGATSTRVDAGTGDDGGDDGGDHGVDAAAEIERPEFPFDIEVKRMDFGILRPTDIVARSDGRAFVLLASAPGVRTGRPMAIVDLESGDIEQTSAAPIPMVKPYGLQLPGDDIFVVNQSRPKDQRDYVYVDVVFYDASDDLWHVVPLPEGELVQSVSYEMTTDGPELYLYDDDGSNGYLFVRDSRTWKKLSPAEPEGCMASRKTEGNRTWVVGLSTDTGELEPCAALFEGGEQKELPLPPSARCLHQIERTSAATWLIGGYDQCGSSMFPTSDKVDVLRDGDGTWERLEPLPVRVFPGGTTVVNDRMLIFDATLGVMAWVPETDDGQTGYMPGQWAWAQPLDGMRINSDWVTIEPGRVATLAWRGKVPAEEDQIVVYTFTERSRPTP